MSDAVTAFLVTWLAGSLRLGGPLLLAATGEIFSERAGVVNVGLEGLILVGALAAFLGAYASGEPWLGMAAAVAAGLLAAGFLAWLYVGVQADQVVVGITFNLLALGLASYLYRALLGGAALSAAAPMLAGPTLPGLARLPVLGPVLFAQPPLFFATVAITAAAAWLLYCTGFGLDLRAVGENPRAAAAAGIAVQRMRTIGVLASGAGGGLAGAYLMLCQIGVFRDDIVSGHGFIALAVVIIGRWNPLGSAIAGLAFGAADALPISLQLLSLPVPSQALLALPYLLTVLAMSGAFGRVAQPAALMVRYERE